MQLLLNFQRLNSYDECDFIISKANESAHSFLTNWPNFGDGNYARLVYLYGSRNSGKTHLAHIFHNHSGAIFLGKEQIRNYLDLKLNAECYIIEDIENLLCYENQLFYIVNEILNQNKYLLITSNLLPADLGLTLKDLSSRINAFNLIKIDNPDEDLLKTLLIKLFYEKQLKINLSVIDYILKRTERSCLNMINLVEEIDYYSKLHKRNITNMFVKQVMDQDERVIG